MTVQVGHRHGNVTSPTQYCHITDSSHCDCASRARTQQCNLTDKSLPQHRHQAVTNCDATDPYMRSRWSSGTNDIFDQLLLGMLNLVAITNCVTVDCLAGEHTLYLNKSNSASDAICRLLARCVCIEASRCQARVYSSPCIVRNSCSI
jgi:hypothetical protein